jgi:hypothetical protein
MSELNTNDYDSEILNNIDEDMQTRQNDLVNNNLLKNN